MSYKGATTLSMDRSELKRLLGKPEPEPAEDGYEEQGGNGRNSRFATFSVILEYRSRDAPSVGYGTMLIYPYHDPSRGVQFVFEGGHTWGWDNQEIGMFRVSILGSNLESLRDRLCQSKKELIREGQGGVTEIKVERWEPAEGSGASQ